MKNKKQELKNKMLTGEQAETVKHFIVDSMKSVYTSAGTLPGDGFYVAATQIADKIIKNAQMALIQNNVFAKAVKNSKPLKKSKKMKIKGVLLINRGKIGGFKIGKKLINEQKKK